MHRQTWGVALGLACLLGPGPKAWAAGGHYAVDDAVILEPEACQVEFWIDKAADGRGTLLHAGPACRVGPVELGLNLDGVRTALNAEKGMALIRRSLGPAGGLDAGGS